MDFQPGMNSQTSLWNRSLRLGVLGIGVAAFWIYTSKTRWFSWLKIFKRRQYQQSIDSKLKLISILDETCSSFHQIFLELAQMVISVQRTVLSRSSKDTRISEDEMEGILMQQGFQLRLQIAEAKVLESNGTCKSELEFLSKQFENDFDIKLRISGLNKMYRDAIKGQLPLLPGIEIPEKLKDEDIVLKIWEETQKRKIELFDAIFQSASPEDLAAKQTVLGSLPSPQLNAQLTSAAERAETEILQRHSDIVASKKLYHHALAHHSRNEEFKRKKAIMDELHSDQVVDVMKRGLNKTNKQSQSNDGSSRLVVILHDKLEHVKSEELLLLIESAEGTKRLILCLVTKKTNDTFGMNLLDELSTEMSALEKEFNTKNLEASFLFTEFDELNKILESVPKCPKLTSDQLPVYLMFEGSQFKKCEKTLKESFDFIRLGLTSNKEEKLLSSNLEKQYCVSSAVANILLDSKSSLIENTKTEEIQSSSVIGEKINFKVISEIEQDHKEEKEMTHEKNVPNTLSELSTFSCENQ